MERLIVVAIGNEADKTIRYKAVSNEQKACQIVTSAREQGLITAVGAINYTDSRDKAYLQIKSFLRKKIMEKVRAKI